MEMPTPCSCCDKLVELNDMRRSSIWSGDLVCEECNKIHYRVYQLRHERKYFKRVLDNGLCMADKRSEFRKLIHELEKEIIDLGYDVE